MDFKVTGFTPAPPRLGFFRPFNGCGAAGRQGIEVASDA
jgi:hypothetical protein